jgi:dynein heavy chain, axonemal
LNEIVGLVRSDVNYLDRATIEALIVLDVHNRDSVGMLVNDKVEKVTDFKW